MNLTDGSNNKIVEDLNKDEERLKSLIHKGLKEQGEANKKSGSTVRGPKPW